jgi:hypothetical protein
MQRHADVQWPDLVPALPVERALGRQGGSHGIGSGREDGAELIADGE